jgi:hypothetical protein
VKARGALFHYSGKSSRRTANPTARRDYHPLAYITLTIAVLSSIHLLHPGEEDLIARQIGA